MMGQLSPYLFDKQHNLLFIILQKSNLHIAIAFVGGRDSHFASGQCEAMAASCEGKQVASNSRLSCA